MQRLELKVPPLVLWAVCAVLVVLLARWLPGANLPFPGHRLLAVVCMITGAALALAGAVAFRRAQTTVNPLCPDDASTLVRTGIYRHTRNPMYLGMALALAGVVSWSASLPGLLLVPAFCAWLARFQIEPEERALRARFGEAYAAYTSEVRRWL